MFLTLKVFELVFTAFHISMFIFSVYAETYARIFITELGELLFRRADTKRLGSRASNKPIIFTAINQGFEIIQCMDSLFSQKSSNSTCPQC